MDDKLGFLNFANFSLIENLIYILLWFITNSWQIHTISQSEKDSVYDGYIKSLPQTSTCPLALHQSGVKT